MAIVLKPLHNFKYGMKIIGIKKPLPKQRSQIF